MIGMLALALLPPFILLCYVYQQDKLQKEPKKNLVKAFIYGGISMYASLLISVPFMHLGLFNKDITSYMDAFRTAFFGAAIPEETAKLVLLWLFLRTCKEFDERMDGIVYAACVGLGFASFENIQYLFAAGTDWVTVGLGRSITAIPAHFGFAVIMGYFFSLHYFDKYRAPGAAIKMWLYPVLLHGTYDWIAMTQNVNPQLSGVIAIAILLLCFVLMKTASKRMKTHLRTDSFYTPNVDQQ